MRSYIISGLSCTGKTTARDHAERLGYLTASVGDVVRRAHAEADPDVPVAEFVLRVHERDGRAAFVREAVAELERRLSRRDESPAGVVVEGVHSPASVGVVRDRFGPTPVVWLRTPPSQRLDRCRQRGRDQSPRDLLRRDLREFDSGLAALATPCGHDVRIDNDGSCQQFERRLEAVFE